jgi:serine/threonine protein kinase
MRGDAEEAARRADLAKSTSRDAEVSVSSAATQTRFSFYNAEEFTTREEPNPHRFNFYNEELQRQATAQTAPSLEEPLSQTSKGRTTLNSPQNNPNSIEILRSFQQHEQQRLNILDDHVDESLEVSTEKSNPYEDAIKEALALLRKHRDPSSSTSSLDGHMTTNSFSPSLQGRPAAIDTNQIRHNIDHGVGDNLFHPVPTDLLMYSQSTAPILHGAFYPSTPSDVMTPGSISGLGDAYQAEIEARRRQRQERMAKYATRLAELKQENGTVASSSSHHERTEDESEHLGLVATSASALERSSSEMVHRLPSQPFVAFPSNQIPNVASGLTTTSRIDEYHQQQVQLGVEKVLLAILDRANSGSGGQQQTQPVSSGWRQEEKKSHSDEAEPILHQIDDEEGDPLVQAVSELLQKPPAAMFKDDMPLVGKEELGQSLALDSFNEDTLNSDVIDEETPTVLIPEEVFPSELRLTHSDPGPEAHAELDRMIEEVLKKNSEGADSCDSSDIYTSDPFNQRVRRILTASSSNEVSDSKPNQEESESLLQDDEDSEIHDSAGHIDSIEVGLEVGSDNENRYDDEASSQIDTDNPTVMNGVLGPLSTLAGGTTGVVLESDSSEESPSLFDSISAVARNFVAGVSSSSESEACSSSTDSSLSQNKEKSRTYELMNTLFAHLISAEFPKTKKRLNDRMPSWDESNPDELGYRVIRLTSEQLEEVQEEYELEMRSRRKEIEKRGDNSLEDDLAQAEEQLRIAERRKKANEVDGGFFSAWSKDFKESDCLQEFPGVKPTGRGEMGDLEFFCLPIIFKSHVTGFEPTKDIYLEAGNIVAGQYLVEGEMGSAAFSTAYRCIDLNSVGGGPDGHEEVCLKVIKNTKDFFDQSLDEIKILELLRQTGMCDQKNILKMKTFFYHREHLIIVTELLRQNLFEFGKFITDNDEEPYFTISRLSYITRQCLIALDFVHKIGLVHSDIKPENILLASYSRAKIKVIDFGSSCYLTDRQSSYIQSRSYRAPEVVLGLPYDGRIDIWSLGCVVAEMFTGEVTFQNDSVVSMLSRIEAICGPVPKRMIRQGRQSGTFYTSSCLLFEKVKKSRKDSDDSQSGDDSSDGSESETFHFDIFQPKKTTLAARLGFAADVMRDYDAGKHLSREQKKQAVFVDFVRSLLTIDPEKRPTAEEALKHPWMEYAATLTEADIKYP